MNVHQNARMTSHGRLLLVRRICEQGWAAAAAAGVPERTAYTAGRPKGARNRATVSADVLLEGEAEALTRKAVESALGGGGSAMRICLEPAGAAPK